MRPASWLAHLEDPGAFAPSQLTDGGSLPALWGRRWAAEPDAATLLVGDADGGPRLGAGAPAGGGTWRSAAALEADTRAAAGRLAAAGLARAERLVWVATPSYPSIVAGLGALRLGAVVVPVNPGCTERELAHVVSSVRPAVAVVARPDQAAWVRAAAPACSGVLTGTLDPVAPAPRLPAAPSDLALDRADPDDPALVVFTSGTTGSPKGAVLRHANLLAGARALALAWRWTPEDRLVLALPLFHVHGLCAGLFGTLCAGASAVVLPRFAPDAVAAAARDEGASLFFGVPTMYHRLLAAGEGPALRRLRLCVSGSAPLPAPLWEALRRDAGVSVLERYGMTETLLTVSNPYDDRRPGSVGVPLPGVEARLDPADGGEGQLWIRGPSVFQGYWERPAETAASFAGEWFATGDVAAVDGDGFLSIRGRRHDLVISGGFNVYPAEVEDVLLAHPAVAEVAVTGEASEEWGETVVAWIVAAGSPPAPGTLEALAASQLAPYKRPRRYRFVDALPRNAMGKVQRDRLRG